MYCNAVSAQNGLMCERACECISIPDLASEMKWTGQVKSYSSGFWRTSTCEYVYEFENLKITINKQSSAAEANQKLTKEYKELIRRGAENMFYTEDETGEGYQTIFGHGHDAQNRHLILLRRRFGDQKELVLRLLTKEESHKVIRDRLRELMSRLTAC